MGIVPLDYRSPGTAGPRRTWWLAIATGAVALLIFLLLPLSGRRVTNWMDAGTGTMRWETEQFGFIIEKRLDISPLEKRLTTLGALPPRDWRMLHTRMHGGVGCGTAPPIYRSMSVLQELVDESSDDELLALTRALQTGTDEEQQHAADAAIERALERSWFR